MAIEETSRNETNNLLNGQRLRRICVRLTVVKKKHCDMMGKKDGEGGNGWRMKQKEEIHQQEITELKTGSSAKAPAARVLKSNEISLVVRCWLNSIWFVWHGCIHMQSTPRPFWLSAGWAGFNPLKSFTIRLGHASENIQRDRRVGPSRVIGKGNEKSFF